MSLGLFRILNLGFNFNNNFASKIRSGMENCSIEVVSLVYFYFCSCHRQWYAISMFFAKYIVELSFRSSVER